LRAILITSLVAVLLVLAGAWWLTTREQDREAAVDTPVTVAQVALAATEDLDFDVAERAWNELRESRPDDPSVTRNWVLNRLLKVDELASTTQNRALSAQARQAARDELPAAIAAARQGIAVLDDLIDDDVLILWLKSRVDLQEAAMLPATMMRGRTERTSEELAGFIRRVDRTGGSSSTLILAGTLADILDRQGVVEDLPADRLRDAAEVFSIVSRSNPDNLFIAAESARLNLIARNEVAKTEVRRAADLAVAIAPEMQARAGGAIESPEVLVDQIIGDIDGGDWNAAAGKFGIWFNLVNSSELMKTDRRRASPHPLDRLSFDTLRELSEAAAADSPLQAFDGSLVFSSALVPGTAEVTRAVVMDVDIDLLPDLVSADADGRLTMHRQSGDGTWTSIATLETDFDIDGLIATDLFMVDRVAPGKVKIVPTAADPAGNESPSGDGDATDFSLGLRHNVVPTLVAFGKSGIKLFSVDGRESTPPDRRLIAVANETGLEDVTGVLDVIDGDLEGDGDLDLIVATETDGLRLFINRGTRRFFEIDAIDRDGIVDLAIVDLDRDLDLDVVTLHGATDEVGLLENLLHLQFRHRPLGEIPAVPGARGIQVAEIDGNVSWDLVVKGDGRTALVYSQTADAGAWTVDRVVGVDDAGGTNLLADFDNDSMLESLSADANDPGRVLLKHLAAGATNGTVDPMSLEIDPAVVRFGAVADFDNDGRPDWFAFSTDGVRVFTNQTETDGHYLQVRLKGIDDNSAASGRVNHYAIGSVVELRFGSHYRAQVITGPVTHFGLDGITSADSLRIIFPNGLTQSIRRPAVDVLLEEEQTLKGSCPYLYAWDGDKFAFVTDCLWAAPLGLQVAAGVVAKDRPWEYLKVDGRHVRPKGDAYELRITEELWEVAYFDHVALAAIDHPADVQIHTNEKVGPDFIATPTIYAFPDSSRHPVESAVDTNGVDVTGKLSAIDQDYVKGFDRRIVQGLCPPHWIDVRLPESLPSMAGDRSIYLVLTGWILPTDTSLNIQIDQNDEMPAVEYPSVWVPGPAGDSEEEAESAADAAWQKVIPFMGFPGGKTKTIVVDVTDVLNRDDPRLRIRTSAQIYWDAAELAVADPDVDSIRHELELKSAVVSEHGYSRRIKSSPDGPETYDYSVSDAEPKWPPLQGPLTRHGDATSLLSEWDDSMVLISGGDEIRLRFAVPDQPVPEGYVRDFVLHCVGWDKDADLNTLTGQMTLPLPFRSMTSYPPTMQDSPRSKRVEHENRNHLLRRQSFREFWHR